MISLKKLFKKNVDICHLKVSANDHVSIKVVGGFEIANTKCEKLLCVKFYRNLTFDNISDICKKVCRKLSTFARLMSYFECQ